MAEQLLKVWDNWEDGIGYLSDGNHHGFAGPIGLESASLIGTSESLRVPPTFIDSNRDFTSGYTFRHAFQEKDTSGNYHLYLLSNDGTNGRIQKLNLASGSFGAAQLELLYTNVSFGHPIRYRGNWYFTGLNNHASAQVMHKLTTIGTGDLVSGDITLGDAGSGDGHLALIGHQMTKVQRATGVSILATDADPTVNNNWGSDFSAGDSIDTTLGVAGLQGLEFIVKGKGIYTFNDRGRAGLVNEDLSAWQGASAGWWAITNWKGGLVFSHKTNLYFYQLGGLPVAIGPQRQTVALNSSDIDYNFLEYRAVLAIGEYIYVWAYSPLANKSWLLCGLSRQASPIDLSWSIIKALSNDQPDSGLGLVTDAVINTGTYSIATPTSLWLQHGTAIKWAALSTNGSPLVTPNSSHLAQTGSSAYMPELLFPSQIRPTKLVAVLENMAPAVNDSFQFSIRVNNGNNINVGSLIVANGRHEIILNYLADVYRVNVGATYSGDSAMQGHTGAAIRRIELWGDSP